MRTIKVTEQIQQERTYTDEELLGIIADLKERLDYFDKLHNELQLAVDEAIVKDKAQIEASIKADKENL